jgi:hypothetical protein
MLLYLSTEKYLRVTSLITGIWMVTCFASAQVVQEPDYVGVAKLLYEGQEKLGDFERIEAQEKTKVGAATFVGVASTKTVYVFPGDKSPVLIKSTKLKSIIFKIGSQKTDPATMFGQYWLTVKGKNRQLITAESVAMSVSSDAAKQAQISCKFEKHGEKSSKALPENALPPGQYGIQILGQKVFYCFEVD